MLSGNFPVLTQHNFQKDLQSQQHIHHHLPVELH